MTKINQTKQQFPTLKNNPALVYLDSGASSLTPQAVTDAMNDYYARYRSNVHRGLYDISMQATQAYEASRASLASFINAEPNEIIFNGGTTHGLNQLAYSLAPRLTHRDNIVLTRMEHHANLVPWQQMAKHYGFEIRFIELNSEATASPSSPAGDTPPLPGGDNVSSPARGEVVRSRGPEGRESTYTLDLNSARNLIDQNTKIVSLTHVSNVLGTINPVEEIIKITRAQSPRAYTIIDAAQSIAHLPIDVKKMDCDFLVASGHKMYGPTGIGFLYAKKIMLQEHLEPFFFGGDMVSDVTYADAIWNDPPYKFEAGTQNIAGAIGLGAAVKFIQQIGWDEIIQHEQSLTNKLINKFPPQADQPMAETNKVQIIGPGAGNNRIGVISFVIPTIHPHDIGEIVNRAGVAIRVGHHCAIPLHKMLGLTGTARASIGVYNTEEDIDKLIEGIKEVKKIFEK